MGVATILSLATHNFKDNEIFPQAHRFMPRSVPAPASSSSEAARVLALADHSCTQVGEATAPQPMQRAIQAMKDA